MAWGDGKITPAEDAAAAAILSEAEQLAACRDELEMLQNALQDLMARTNQLAMEAELAYLELNQVFKNAADCIRVIDKNFQVTRCNETFQSRFGVLPAEVLQRNCHASFRCSLCQTGDCPLQVIQAGGEFSSREVEWQDRDGAGSYFLISALPFRAPDGELVGIVEYLLDITSRVRAERELRESQRRYMELSIVDDLTKLFNKRYFVEKLAEEITRAERYQRNLSLLLMDIDNFKHFNDTYGHPAGDEVIARLGRVLLAATRKTDFAFRYGGEEFVVVMPETDVEQALVVAERIRSRFAGELFQPNEDEEVRKTISIGLTRYIFGEESDGFVNRADQNMYKAKTSGKNRVIAG